MVEELSKKDIKELRHLLVLWEDANISDSILMAEPGRESQRQEIEESARARDEETFSNEVPVPTPTDIISTAEATERSGSTYLFVVIALVLVFAIGAGYVSHRTDS